jgi:hypothetical protein
MDEDAAVQAIESTIDANRASLMSGLTQNNVERTIGYLSDTWLGLPVGYYAVKIKCEEAVEQNHPETASSNQPSPYLATYRMTIGVGDYVVFDPNDQTAGYGSTAQTNFRDFTDRLVALFRRDQDWYPNASASPRFRIQVAPGQGRVVRKLNRDPTPLEDGTHILYSEITFMFTSCHT